jgi:hypothetical protein
MGYNKTHKLEKVEVEFALYRPGKAPGRFFGNPRNVRETAHPGIDAKEFVGIFDLFFYS